uniref:Uncharacterized protein n=1 Tax=Megaselia scalaris TaxID=36166 RepID=T1GSX3_MEGSC
MGRFLQRTTERQRRTSPHGNQSQKFQNNEDVPPPTRAKVDKAIQRLKSELLKTAGAGFNRIFHEILKKIWSSENIPQEWKGKG